MKLGYNVPDQVKWGHGHAGENTPRTARQSTTMRVRCPAHGIQTHGSANVLTLRRANYIRRVNHPGWT
eukprot:9689518-Lingulodinium_polyedra.AAC.1